MPNILKYFMKPKAEEYQFPEADKITDTLEELIRLHENIPEQAAEEKPAHTPHAQGEQPFTAQYHTAEQNHLSGQVEFSRTQASAILNAAEQQAAELLEKAKFAAEAEVAEIHKNAAEKGYNDGYAEGRARGEQEAREHTREAAQKAVVDVTRFLEQASLSRDKAIDNLRGELVDVAVAVAEKVIRVSLKSSDEIIKRMILAATERLKRREWVHIYIADCDVRGMTQTDPMLAAALSSLSDNVKIVPMPGEESGTCVVEMPDEIIDASASTQLDNIRGIIRDARP